jgi:hypothetical protein
LISDVSDRLSRPLDFEGRSAGLSPFLEGVLKSESAIGFMGYASWAS